MVLAFARHEKIKLKNHPDFCEAWLHEMICQDTSLLGLGDLDVIERERLQYSGGRIDLLLGDVERQIRYEVEIMLGQTDPSHIIRCIEYWDIERRRYPAYDHVAVIVAEEITTRFLNVMSLLAGSIPLIAIQLNALRIEQAIVLDFVRVLDQRLLRHDDTVESDGNEVDRQYWEGKKGSDSLQVCDRILAIVSEKNPDGYGLRYKKHHISIGLHGSFFNLATFWPRKKSVRFRLKIHDAESWAKNLEQLGFEPEVLQEDRLQFSLALPDLQQNAEAMRSLLHQAIDDAQSQ